MNVKGSFNTILSDTPPGYYTVTEHVFYFLGNGHVYSHSSSNIAIEESIISCLSIFGFICWSFSIGSILAHFTMTDLVVLGEEMVICAWWLVGWLVTFVCFASMYHEYQTPYLTTMYGNGWLSMSCVCAGMVSWLGIVIVLCAIIGVYRRNTRLRKERFEKKIRGHNT